MSIGNQKFGIPRKYQYQIGVWYLCPKFLGIFLVFYWHLENDLHKIWLNIGISRQNKNRFGIWFLWLQISLVSVWFWFVIFLKVASLVREGTMVFQGCQLLTVAAVITSECVITPACQRDASSSVAE